MSLHETTGDKRLEVFMRIFYATRRETYCGMMLGSAAVDEDDISLKLCQPLRRCSKRRACCLFGTATF
ncbi:hypothetical protein [Rhizobium leguminosarum]|uniref:hypothetical protein n=1 Tax=Rhizobium leguminosarum TaxID=384 RepID=UPI00103AE066|nr:hypothetical protein [Rhizobium leguminosarum]TBZ77014.1 hypothetical protein E0H43_06855 [Rhizobium leguminosarum bv. viciae]